MSFEFVNYEQRKSALPEPIIEENYDAWAKVHYGLMKRIAECHPKFKVSNDPFEPTEIYYGDDWFGIRKSAVVATSWRAFCFEVIKTIQEYVRTEASDWFVTFAVEGSREAEVGNPQLTVLISKDRVWVGAYKRSAAETICLCKQKDVFAWLLER